MPEICYRITWPSMRRVVQCRHWEDGEIVCPGDQDTISTEIQLHLPHQRLNQTGYSNGFAWIGATCIGYRTCMPGSLPCVTHDDPGSTQPPDKLPWAEPIYSEQQNARLSYLLVGHCWISFEMLQIRPNRYAIASKCRMRRMWTEER